ncbi:MAG: FGGY family carbohydrate kinase [Bacteroidota bacterium]|nr:FGGY family carbohydrate kinase [Bacteroidota bacterium]
MYLLGIDIGSSSVKASIIQIENGALIASSSAPKTEMKILAPKPGWAEQHPDLWWENLKICISDIKSKSGCKAEDIQAIGIAYQMHGLVCVDINLEVLRPSIIWCDSRAVAIGEKALSEMGEKKTLSTLLNSPGNFTASKLKWVQENEPKIYDKIYKIMLPGDYIALKLSGEIQTTVSGLSEGIFWDFEDNEISKKLLKQYKINSDLIPNITDTFSKQAFVSKSAAKELGLKENTPITYRAGDQPNNAFSLNVLKAGEIAATAGTSGVVYGVHSKATYDKKSRVNTFVHVNHQPKKPSYGVLLCINGTGIQNSWLRNSMLNGTMDYEQMNKLASKIPAGADGLRVFPFGNGAERVLENKDFGGMISGIQFNRHSNAHILRAAQEGIAFGLNYGVEVMKDMGMEISVIRAGEANMFLSPIFREVFCNTTGAVVELYNTDGAQGAARGAGIGAGIYKDAKEAFKTLKKVKTIEPDKQLKRQYKDLYHQWADDLKKMK